MSPIQYTPSEYRTLLRFSHNKHLLVEGKGDKRLFEILLNEFGNQRSEDSKITKTSQINIDSAESLISFDRIIGNREKVEEICKSVENQPYYEKLVGFVDREFREFELGESIQDNLTQHRVQGQLVWSCGHSIENYFFDFSILRPLLRALSKIDFLEESITLFETVIESTIRLACAASLAGYDLEKLDKVKNSLYWELLEIIPTTGVALRLDTWEQILVEKRGLSTEEVMKIINHYKIWHSRIEKTDFKTVRWICHGHIGMKFIIEVYSRCVYEVCSFKEGVIPKKQVDSVRKLSEDDTFNFCAEFWSIKAISNQCNYPIEVLKLLGFTFA